MIPELGQFSLILALCIAVVQAVLPLAGAARNRRDWMMLARPAAAGQFVFVLLAFAVLAHAFLTDDFSVRYVASNSNTMLPTLYKFAAVWGAHEGSLLLWCLVLASWTLAVAIGSRQLNEAFAARVLGVLGIVSIGILAFTLFTSNPFLRLLPAAADGVDLNPLLQDPALAVHPPMLYIGYVGFSVAFAFACAAMMSGRIEPEWARWTRPWTLWAWMFLTCGIALGSWWAYYELGWGGWWFWDAVENASFMPWLVGTALLHSLAVTEKRGLFMSWTLLLAIIAFSLSLLGTFLVRSGVIVSVHAFASDPTRGLFILMLLGVISGGAFLLYALKASQFVRQGGFALVSRESFLLVNNALLVAAAALVLFGTLYPMILDAVGGGKINVGAPYFDVAFAIPMLPVLLLLGIGMHSAWRGMPLQMLLKRVRIPAIAAVVLGILTAAVVYDYNSLLTTIGVIAALWILGAALLEPIQRLRNPNLPRLSGAMWGMVIAHVGVGLFVLGVTVTSSFNVEDDLAARPGETLNVAGYDFNFVGLKEVRGPNYDALEGEFEVRRNGDYVTTLRPQKRVYNVRREAMTEASIDARITRDLFIALGEDLGADRWSLRIQYKPLISLLWLGALTMAVGGFVASMDRRYRGATAEARNDVPAGTAPSAPIG